MKEEYRIKGTYLKADTINGVQVCDSTIFEDDPEIEIISLTMFYDLLKSVDENETLYSHADGDHEELFDKIDEEYGIH